MEMGPQRVLLQFDETLEGLGLSTGKPKTTDYLVKTAFLRLRSNKVADIVTVETSDNVFVSIKLASLVDFVGDDQIKWFGVSNYVKLLTDHVRSVLRAAVRQISIQEFIAKSEEIVRDSILGTKGADGRKGMEFDENSMKIVDVEVLDVSIADRQIRTLIHEAQHETVTSMISLQNAQRELEVAKELQRIRREKADAEETTTIHLHRISLLGVGRGKEMIILDQEAKQDGVTAKTATEKLHQAKLDLIAEAELARHRSEADQQLATMRAELEIKKDKLDAETKANVEQLNALNAGLGDALLSLGRQDVAVKVAEALNVQQIATGESLVDLVKRLAGSEDSNLFHTLTEYLAAHSE